MPRISKQVCHLKRAREIQAQKLKEKKNDKRRTERLTNKEQFSLISSIQKLSEEELPAANHLIRTMHYPKGPNKGKLISPYFQNKAQEYVLQNLYKNKTSITSLQETNNKMVSKIKQL
ncbi:unnamed protein product [Rhizophagus irregularis]|uniref:Uncharacterized protein n=1 Tax=Rhizophagus irregularis TaxID=588596 RepID=A0A2I1GQN5_9GLOM|nr:hypothetical protein RhiirA4_464552 [Rhizophagus irregularis]CAB4440615.1 unnamed protein product [Rhizophagus irregularis]